MGMHEKEIVVQGMTPEEGTIKAWVNDNDEYVGDKDTAAYLTKLGIQPQLIDDKHRVCSIGYSELDGKWYGWSHRAIYGFEIGSEVKKGDCGYVPTDKDDFLEDCVRFWDDKEHVETKGEHTTREIVEYEYEEYDQKPHGDLVSSKMKTTEIPTGKFEDGVYVSWTYDDTVPNESLRGTVGGVFTRYPGKYGKGEWVAETMEDAKQMAIDFAKGVA